MNFKNQVLIIALSLGAIELHAQSSGQNYTISPYSNYGLGEVLNLNLAEAGHSGQTHSGSYSYSFFNPATIGNLKFTTFDFGMNYRYGLVESSTAKRSFQGGGLSYLSLGFRSYHRNIPKYIDSAGTRKKIGFVPLNLNSYITVYPTTSVGYNYTVENSNPFLTRTAHSGKGGLNAIETGHGFSPGRHITIGYSVAYLFGQLSDRSIFSAPDSSDLFIIDDEKAVNVKGFRQQIGAQYQFKIDSTYHRFGASMRWYSGTKAANTRLTQVFGYVNGSLTSADTVLNQTGSYQKISMPGGLGVGYNFQWRKKWSVAVDYYSEKWSNYSAFFQPSLKLANRTDFGFTFVLNPVDEKYGKSKNMPLPIRFGLRYSNTQNVFNSSSNTSITITENNMFLGFGIPITRRYFDNQVLRSMINVRVDYTSRGSLVNGLAKEQYLVTTLSFNLGDIWFQRRKFD